MTDRDMTDEELEREIERIEETENAWEGTEEVEVDVRQPLDKVIPVRFSSDQWDAVYAEARERGVGPSTLVRMWVLEKLREAARARRYV